MNTLTPQQALSILDHAVAMLTLTRTDHAKLNEAVQVLNKIVAEDPKKD